jgi:UDP-N-acetylmuramyl tripeptide synthase
MPTILSSPRWLSERRPWCGASTQLGCRRAARERPGRRPGAANVRTHLPGETEHVALRLLGEHQATNAAAVTATALAAGRPLGRIATSLRAITHLSKWRMQLLERTDGLVVVNDAYNANPDSMRAALETLAAMGSGRRKGRCAGGDARARRRECRGAPPGGSAR